MWPPTGWLDACVPMNTTRRRGRSAASHAEIRIRHGVAAVVLDSAIAASALDLHLQFQLEIADLLIAAVNEKRGSRRILLGGLGDDDAVPDAPDLFGAVPAVEAAAVEDLGEAGVVIEINRGGCAATEAAASSSGGLTAPPGAG